jgi:cytochrome c-type biogenesis protein CcmH/NrfF
MHGDALTAIRALAAVEYKIHSRPGPFVKLKPNKAYAAGRRWDAPSLLLYMTAIPMAGGTPSTRDSDSEPGREGENDQRTSHELIAKSASPNSS